MSGIHIYTAPGQPATDFWDRNTPDAIHITLSPYKRIHCRRCRGIHQARNMTVQVYYDGWRFTCTSRKQWYARSICDCSCNKHKQSRRRAGKG